MSINVATILCEWCSCLLAGSGQKNFIMDYYIEPGLSLPIILIKRKKTSKSPVYHHILANDPNSSDLTIGQRTYIYIRDTLPSITRKPRLCCISMVMTFMKLEKEKLILRKSTASDNRGQMEAISSV